MVATLLAVITLIFAQAKTAEYGVIAGTIPRAGDAPFVQPVQVVLLSPHYFNLWSSDVQKRLDIYWERYKPAFAQRKEFFREVSRMAHRDAIYFVINRMRRDLRASAGDYVKETSDGKFEFQNVPFGEYRVVAHGKVSGEEYVWQETIEVNSTIPQFLEMKKRLP